MQYIRKKTVCEITEKETNTSPNILLIITLHNFPHSSCTYTNWIPLDTQAIGGCWSTQAILTLVSVISYLTDRTLVYLQQLSRHQFQIDSGKHITVVLVVTPTSFISHSLCAETCIIWHHLWHWLALVTCIPATFLLSVHTLTSYHHASICPYVDSYPRASTLKTLALPIQPSPGTHMCLETHKPGRRNAYIQYYGVLC